MQNPIHEAILCTNDSNHMILTKFYKLSATSNINQAQHPGHLNINKLWLNLLSPKVQVQMHIYVVPSTYLKNEAPSTYLKEAPSTYLERNWNRPLETTV